MQTNPNQLDLFGFLEPAVIATAPVDRPDASAANTAKPTFCAPAPACVPEDPVSSVLVCEPIEIGDDEIHQGRPILPNELANTSVLSPSDVALDATVMTFAEHRALMSRVAHGDTPVQPDYVRASFERLVRDVEAVKAELAKFKVADLMKHLTGYVREKRKGYLVDSLTREMVTDYGLLASAGSGFVQRGYLFEDAVSAVRRKLSGLTADTLLALKVSLEKDNADRQERRDAFVKALTNPETLEEFKVLIDRRGLASMNADQRALYDELVADQMRSASTVSQVDRTTIKGVDVGVSIQIVETKHTRDGHDLWVVKLGEKVGEDKFKQLSSAAKRLGGYYSSYARDGAVTGFQFKAADIAAQFVAIARGESVDNSRTVEVREEKRSTAALSRLRGTAERTRESAEAKLNQPRLTNTRKRAMQASYAEADARKAIALADTMSNIADAIESGRAKHLEQLTEKSQVELFKSLLARAKNEELLKEPVRPANMEARRSEPATIATVDFVQFPHYFVYDAAELETFIGKIAGKDGLVRLAAKLKPYVQACRKAGENGKFILPADLITPCIEKLGAENSVLPRFWADLNLYQKRLARMGIATPEQLRAACREFVQFQAKTAKADRATELERQLVGAQVGVDFFPTPRAECEVLVAKVDLKPGETALEPQAGSGNIAMAIRAVGVEPDVIEISEALREILDAKGFTLVGRDFLEFNDKKYDAIVMNPPFSADAEHVLHGFNLLNENGRLAAIVGEGTFIRNDSRSKAFRAWLEEVDAEVEKLDEGTFSDRSLLRTTGANARRVTIRRGDAR